MKNKFKVVVVIGLLYASLSSFASNVNAVAIGGTENFKVNEIDNKKALEFVENTSDLKSSPVPIKNLTTQQPFSSSTILLRATKKLYTSQDNRQYPAMFRINYLAPVGFNWHENGIPAAAVTITSNHKYLYFVNVQDTGIGGYGTGGYYWRYFKTSNKYYWLSAWNYNHLVYG